MYMRIARTSWKSKNGKVYESVWLRQSYREGRKTGKRAIANLKEGLSVGAVWTVYEMARVLDQGSRLPAVRWARVHAACDVLGLQRGFNENDLYENLTWLSEQQARMEKSLFKARRGSTKPQIEMRLKANVFPMELFDEALCEVEHAGVRYILRRNPVCVREIARTRASKRHRVERLVQDRNRYLSEHGRAHGTTAVNKVREKIERLALDGWLSAKDSDRVLTLYTDEERLEEQSRLDGCCVLKTDVHQPVADTTLVHQRYKDLAEVEQAFRTSKTVHLEMRPVFVRNEANTRGHVFVVRLAYLIRRALSRAWRGLADLEKRLGRTEQAQRYQRLAERLKASFLKTFYNPETGWLGLWKSRDGVLHDIPRAPLRLSLTRSPVVLP